MELEMADGSNFTIPEERSMVMNMMNGRFGGTGVPFAPCALLNDGLFDLVFQHGPTKFSNYCEFVNQGIVGGGKQLYLNNYEYIRARKMKLINRNIVEDSDD